MTGQALVTLSFVVQPVHITIDRPPRNAFWDSLMSKQAAGGEQVTVAANYAYLEDQVRANFADKLAELFRGAGWQGAGFKLLTIRYESLTIAVLVAGAKSFMDAVEQHPHLFEELLLALAPQALDQSLGITVSPNLKTSVSMKHGNSPSATAIVAAQVRPLIPLLLALALLSVLAYNELIDARSERSAIAEREGKFIDRQQKLLEAQTARIESLERRLTPENESA